MLFLKIFKMLNKKRFAAIDEVDIIITQELSEYSKWLHEAPLRALLAEYKLVINQKVVDYFEPYTEKDKIKKVTNQIMRKLMHQTDALHSSTEINTIISEQVNLLKEIPV